MTDRYIPLQNYQAFVVHEALGGETRPIRDTVHGGGDAFLLSKGNSTLEVFPGVPVARLRSKDAILEIYRFAGLKVDADAGIVVFEHGHAAGDAQLIVSADSQASL